jgi:hypothetical protein
MREYSSEMLASFYKVTSCHIPEDNLIITAMRNSHLILDLINSMELKPFREATSCATTQDIPRMGDLLYHRRNLFVCISYYTFLLCFTTCFGY